MRLAPALDPGSFPEAERSVLLLDGEAVPLGLTVIPVDVPVGPAVRAASLAAAVARFDLVVDLRTAAWVHGAVPALPRPLTLAVDVSRSRRTKLVVPPPREARFRHDDLLRLGGVLVTTPLKTAFDLLRLDDDADPALDALAAALLREAGLTAAVAAALAHLQPGCPHKQRGIDRLAALP
ncbi:hypothetical protein GCM10025783_14080 [Amnibacterium soli]|uniref:AbiEi antitoxin C-terminal domain-containing protein n=1 Tax=Amnibacterium soli TaxID=1282736 RepID=A0ABP8Z1D9_9MICO